VQPADNNFNAKSSTVLNLSSGVISLPPGSNAALVAQRLPLAYPPNLQVRGWGGG